MTALETRTKCLTESNKATLEKLLEYVRTVHREDQRYLDILEQELDLAEVVAAADVSPDVVTMHSRVRVRHLETRRVDIYTLVFPQEADFSQKRISILAPMGTALLGSREGDLVEWKVPAGTRRLKIESVLYQPETDGDESDLSRGRERASSYQAVL